MNRTRLLRQFWQHLARTRWWERAVTALYLTFAVQDVGQDNAPAALIVVAISALFAVTPFAIFRHLPLVVQPGLVVLGCWLVVMFLTLG